MRKNIFALIFLFSSFNAYSKFNLGYEKHVSGHYIKRVVSLSEDDVKRKQIYLANPKSGYHVEIEKSIEGFAGPGYEKDLIEKKLKAGIGISFTSGLTYAKSKKVKNLVEADSFAEENFFDYFKASRALKMNTDESVHTEFFAGVVFEPEIGSFGIWAVATGGWDLVMTKKENNIVQVELSLINSKMASFYFDKMGAMFSYDIGKDLEKGFELTLNLNDPKAKEAYERLFKGNILFAQTEAKKNPNIRFQKSSEKVSNRRGLGLWVRTPLVALFLLNTTHHLVDGETVETNLGKGLKTKSHSKKFSASYEESNDLEFLGTYTGLVRKFESSFDLKEKNFESSDIYELESNIGSTTQMAFKSMRDRTLMDEYFGLILPEVKNDYYHYLLEVKYSERFLSHLMSGMFDVEQLKKSAVAKLDEEYVGKLGDFRNGNIYVLLAQKEFERGVIYTVASKIENLGPEMRKLYMGGQEKEVVKKYAELMKLIYKSPALYKTFVDYSKRCGLEVNLTIETQAYAKRELKNEFKEDERCTD